MAGRQASSAVTRYAGIQVQTSSLGTQIPVGWGTFRCRCNLVDYLDFTSTAQKASSGKGGGVVTGYSYTATIILAICEGPIDNVTQVWVDSNNYAFNSVGSGVANTGSIAAMSQIGLTMFGGTIGQAVWSYLTSAHPDHAIGYSGLALGLAENYPLDSGASTPNHSFEVVRTTGFAVGGGYAGPDVDPSLVVADFFQNTRTGVPGWPASGLLGSLTQYQDYCLAAGLLVSPVIDQERSASDFLTELLLATNSTCVWSEGLLKFIPYGDTNLSGNGKTFTPPNTPVYSLDDDDFIVKQPGDAPLLADLEDQSDAYNVVQLEYLDRTNAYNMAIALASDQANVQQFGMRRQDPTTVHCICTPGVAQIASQLYLQRTLYIRGQYRFTLDWRFALLEPGDILAISDYFMGLFGYTVRVIQIDEDEKDGTLALTCEDYPIGVHHTPTYAMQNGQTTYLNLGVDPGGVEANLLLWSQDWTNAAWNNTHVTVTAAATTNPVTGASDAQKLLPTTSNALHTMQQPFTGFSGANYCFTVYLKADGYTKAQITISDNTANGVGAFVDLSAGTITAQAPFGAGVVIGASITSVGSGWYRAQIVGQIPATALFAEIYVANAAGSTTYAGDGTSAIYAWGAQLTQGVDVRPYAVTTTVISGPQIFNPPSVVTQGGLETWAALAGGPNWGGADVWVSLDGGSTYEFVAETAQAGARFGPLTASYGAGADPDTTDTLSVDLSASSGALTSAATSVADANGTLCLVDQEIISFSTATLTNPNRYDLTSYVRRGCLGTTIAAHSAGAELIRLDSAIVKLPFLTSQAGAYAYAKFQSWNLWGKGQTPLSNCRAYPFQPASNLAGSSPNGNTLTGGDVTPTSNPTYATLIDPTLAGLPAPTGSFWFNPVNGILYQRQNNGWIAVTVAASQSPGAVLMSSVAPGPFSLVIPATATAHAQIFVIGGGGGGGGVHGGGGSGWASTTVAVTPGSTTFAGTIGSQGISSFSFIQPGVGVVNVPATAGTPSSVTSSAFAGTMTANGGGSGFSAAGTPGTASGPSGGSYVTGEAGDTGGTGHGGACNGGAFFGGARATTANTNGNWNGGGAPVSSGASPTFGGHAAVIILTA